MVPPEGKNHGFAPVSSHVGVCWFALCSFIVLEYLCASGLVSGNLMRFIIAANLLGLPAISVPVSCILLFSFFVLAYVTLTL